MVKKFRPACLKDWDNCSIMSVLPLLLDMEVNNGEYKISPPNFMKEMLLSTEERYEKLIHPTRSASCISGNLKSFKVVPDIVVFQNFTRGEVYLVQLHLMNIQDTSKTLRIDMKPSSYFSLKYPADYVGSKVAPGLKFSFEICFSADILQDYKHKVTFVTSSETFDVPIIALGPRPLLDFPDKIILPTTTIKTSTERTIIVKNIGEVWVSFMLEASERFEVKNNREVLKPEECCTVTVFYHPKAVGLIQGELKVMYETGEILFIRLEGKAEEADMHLSLKKVSFVDCGLGLSQERTVTLENKSDFVLDYRWISHECSACRARIKSAIKERFEDLMEYELNRDNALEYHDIVDSEMNREIYKRILEEQKKECDMTDEPLYSSRNFEIEPKFGQLWPKNKINFSVFYVPKDVEIHKSIAYLSITGRTRAYSLQMIGFCDGPRIDINLEELDAQNIYIGSVHRYEVMFINGGAIPGTIKYLGVEAHFGGEFECSEDSFLILPEDKKSVFIQFSSLTRGKFTESVKFEIVESGEPLSFMMKGNIVCPLLNFDVTYLNFGDLSVGETKRLSFHLENNTQVSIEYQVEILSDHSLFSFGDEADCSDLSCSSTSGIVEAYKQIPYFVQVTPNAAIEKKAELAITMWESRQQSRTVYILYKAHVPLIQCTTPKISMKSMFINQTYYRILTIENKSEYSGYLTLDFQDGDNLQITTEKNNVFVKPWDTYDFKIEIMTTVIGDMEGTVTGFFSGAHAPFTICEVFVISRGPCIDSNLTDTNIGKVNTLTLITMPFTLSNDSPIPATVSVNISGPFITPAESVINLGAESTVESSLLIYGTCAGRFKTSIKLEIDGTVPDCVIYTGEFVGGSISTDPHLDPAYDIGSISTMTTFIKEIMFHNEGKVGHTISIKEYETYVYHFGSTPIDNGRPYFILPNDQFLINPGKYQPLFIDCFAKTPCKVTTRFVCHAKRQSKRNQIFKKLFDFKLMATFEVPHVTLSKPSMEFRIDIGTENTIAVLEDDISLANESNQPLHMEISLDEPFYFASDNEYYNVKDVVLEVGEEMSLLISFKPDMSEKKIQVKRGLMKIQYVMHPNLDKLPLYGIVNYPNVAFEPNYLDFGCIPIGHSGRKLISLINQSPLTVVYNFEINDSKIKITPIEYESKEVHFDSSSATFDSLLDCIPPEKRYLQQLLQEEYGENEDEYCRASSTNDEETSVKSSLILANEDCLEIAKLTYQDDELQGALRPILYPLLEHFTCDENIIDSKLTESLKTEIDIDEKKHIIDIVPKCGTLAPYEYHIISVAVRPPTNVIMAATISCNVAGGAPSELSILLKSSQPLYYLKSKVVDFGIIPFNVIASTSFKIENIGYSKFEYSVKYNTCQTHFMADPGWIEISPSEGVIAEGSVAVIVLQYFPGYPGYFETSASLEIAFFDGIKLTIKGCAVLPQLYFDFPRALNDTQNILAYYAIADITYAFHSQCDEEFTSQTEREYDDWEFVRYKRHYPSLKDIAMAVERKIIQQHFTSNPNLVAHKYNNPTAIIPDLTLPPYIIDLGYVILNTELDVLITPFKYSDFTTKLFWLRIPRKYSELGFALVFQKGQAGPFLVFKPTAKMFAQPNMEAVGHLSCIINSTIKIDFEVKAIVTVPSLIFKSTSVDFGRVQCGFALKKTFFLENNGAVTCSYKILIQSTSERPSNIFFTKMRDGVVNAGQYARIDIFFQPQARAKYDWRLMVYIEANKTPLKIALRGSGFLPELEIIDDKIYFEPTLPYSINNVKYVKIINRSQFPVEISFAHVDKELSEEARIVKAILNVHNVKKLFIPPRLVGDPLPASLTEMYKNIVNALRTILKRKIKLEYMALVKKMGHEERASCYASTECNESLETISDPLEDRTKDEMHALLMENILEIRTNNISLLGIHHKESIYELAWNVPVDEEDNGLKEGILIIFYGSPCTDFVFAANKAAHGLHIQVKDIDELIYESLARNEILASYKVGQTIEDKVAMIQAVSELYLPSDSDAIDIIKAKVSLILSKKLSEIKLSHTKSTRIDKDKKGKDKTSDKNSSAKSDKSEKSSDKNETFLRLPLDFFYEILADGVSKYPTGLVISSLHSVFITKPKLALIGLLKAAGNIRYMQGVYFAVSIESFRNKLADDNWKSGEVSEDGNDVLNDILLMNQEQFDQISASQLKLFEELYLSYRKMDSERRLKERERRIKAKIRKLTSIRLTELESTGRKHKKSVHYDKESQNTKSSKKDAKKKSSIFPALSVEDDSSWAYGRSQISEESLIAAEMEAFEMRFILEHWNRAQKELIQTIPNTIQVITNQQKRKPSQKSKDNERKSAASVSSKSSSKSKHARNDSSGSNKSKKDVLSRNDLEPDLPRRKTIKYLTLDEMQLRSEIGIPMFYFSNARADSKVSYSDLIAQFLLEDEELAEAKRLVMMQSLGDHREVEQLYTVLSEPLTEKQKSNGNQFVLYDCSTTRIPAKSHPSSASIAEGGSTKKSKSVKSVSLKRSSTSVVSAKKSKRTQKGTKISHSVDKSLIPRRIMQPEDEITLEVNFYPQNCGVFSHYIDIEIVTLPIPYRIYLEGKSDVPRIYMEPSILFSKILPEKPGHELSVAYFEKEGVYHMGAVAAQSVDSRNNCLIVEDKLHLINESFLACNLTIDFLESTTDFSVDNPKLSILSNNSQFLTIRGHPVEPGTINASLIFTNTNNPRVNTIHISELGTTFNIDINPRDVIFDRVLLNRVVHVDMMLKNTSCIGTHWEINFKNIDDFGISVTSGYIKPLGVNIVTFAFEATEYKIVPVQEIDIKFFDKSRHCEAPILQEKIKLIAEVVEVGVEFETEMQLGDNKIGQLSTYMYTFKNKSKFELEARFFFLENEPPNIEMDMVRKNVCLESETVPIKANDVTKVPISFKINIPMEFRAVPVFNVIISDPLVQREVMSYILKATGKVISTSYKLCPSDELIFSTQLVDTEVCKDIVLHNNGKYSFTFNVLNGNDVRNKKKRIPSDRMNKKQTQKASNVDSLPLKSDNSAKTSKKSKGSKKTKSKASVISSKLSTVKTKKKPSILLRKNKPSVLKQGNFIITPSSGSVQPHNEIYIQITCTTKKVGSFAENIIFVISGVTGKHANGHPLSLQGTACLPDIDLHTTEFIFREHMIAEYQQDALCREQLISSCLYIICDQIFYFQNTCIQLEAEACLHFRNLGEIGAFVRGTIKGDDDTFQLHPEVLHIDPYSSQFFVVSFKPTALKKYEDVLHITVDQSDAQFELGLHGEGCLPILQIMEPLSSPEHSTYEIDFKLVLLGMSPNRSIVLHNPGTLKAKVVIGVVDDPNGNIALEAKTCQPFQHISNLSILENVFETTALLLIKPGESEEIIVHFTPKTETMLNAMIKVFISNNPYDFYIVHITGQGYKEDVIIEHLESFLAPELAEKALSYQSIDSNGSYTKLCYKLEFGSNHIGKLNKKYVKLKNISEQDTYRFVFMPQDNLTWVPSIGHLKPQSSKEIIVTFYSEQPISFQNKLQLCKLTKITYVDPPKLHEPDDIGWDERQQYTIWIEDIEPESETTPSNNDSKDTSEVVMSTKMITNKEEPRYVELEESLLRLIVNILVDYCSYEQEITEINFPPTPMFQFSEKDFTVKNTSEVPVHIDWFIQLGTHPHKSRANIPSINSSLFPPILELPKKRPKTCYFGRQPQTLIEIEKYPEFHRPKSISEKRSIFSSSFASSGIASIQSYCDSDPLPITINPEKATIPPQSSITFTLKFAPFSALEYNFLFSSEIPNLKPDMDPIRLKVYAPGILPLYHFKIEPCDYLTSRRGKREHCEIAVEEGTKVLEFNAVGFGLPVQNQFSIINPTNETFSYRWERAVKERSISLFQCDNPEGTVLKGRTVDVTFTFIADKAGTFEMFYYFTIEKYNLRVMFLLVGHARQPCVYFVNNGKCLKPTVMGIDVHDTCILKNTEAVGLSYKIIPATLYHEERTQKLIVEPQHGYLHPNTDNPIKITYRPKKIGRVNFNIHFQVEMIQKPLMLSLSATCYNIEPTLKAIRDFLEYDLLIDSDNLIHLPVLVQRNPEKCTFLIGNVGKVGFYYSWDCADQFIEDFVNMEIVPREGYVKTNSEVPSEITVNAVKFLNNKYIKLALKILYGPTVPITLVCTTCKVRLKFSETQHDFGACLAQKHPTFNNEWSLELSNNDYINYIIQIENRTFDHLSFIRKDSVLKSKCTTQILVYFHPKEVLKYNTKVNILVNDRKYPITIIGEGVSMEVELLNISDKFINIGAVPLGKYSKKCVSIVNKTKCPVSIYFDLYNRLPIFAKSTRNLEPNFEHMEIKPSDLPIRSKKTSSRKIKAEKGSKKSPTKTGSKTTKESKSSKGSEKAKKASFLSQASGDSKSAAKGKRLKRILPEKEVIESSEEIKRNLIYKSVRVRPLKFIKLFPQNSIEYTITFKPVERISVFQEQIYCQVEGTVIPLCSMQASCIAPQYSFPKCKVSFGTVILGASNKNYAKLINSGDVGGRFKWSWKTTRNEAFSINPMEGYSTPGSCINFEVNFKPSSVKCNFNSNAKLTIENYKNTFEIELYGTCINLPNPQDTLMFSGPVRETITKQFTLKNNTPEPWWIKPITSGEFFHVDELIVVEAMSSFNVKVTYTPLTMTQDNKYHEASIFLPLPEGQGMLYKLLGESLRPKTISVIEKTVPSKTYNDINLDVYNWLKVTQQFTVINQIEQPEGSKKVLYKFTSPAIMEVPPCVTKAYKWTIYTLNEGKLCFKVKFRNEETKEYNCYEIKLTVVKCQVLDNITLSVCARGVAEYKMKLENPLGQPTTYKLSSHCTDLYFVKETSVAAYTEVEILIEYKPLFPAAEFTSLFEAVSPNLGTFPYNFILTAKPAEMESTITIETPLGQKNSHNAYIYNSSNINAEFTSRIDNTEFIVERVITVKPGERGVVEIGFEPSDLGGVYSKLSLSSPTLGLYIFPLYGVGLPPKPQGPFIVKPNFQTFLPFKNPFTEGMTFLYTVTGIGFKLKSSSEFVKPRSMTRINISYDQAVQTIDQSYSILTGKVSIICTNEEYSGIEWVLYLQSSHK